VTPDYIEIAALERRAMDAFDVHMDTYTASAVLHDIYMDIFSTDLKGIEALSLSFALLSAYREKTRKAWVTAQDEWLYASGMAYDSELYDDVEDSGQ